MLVDYIVKSYVSWSSYQFNTRYFIAYSEIGLSAVMHKCEKTIEQLSYSHNTL